MYSICKSYFVEDQVHILYAARKNILTALVRMMPYNRPYLMFGSVTFQKTCQSVAPMVLAASSSARSMVSSIGMSSRTTKGIVTKSVANAIPAPWRRPILTAARHVKVRTLPWQGSIRGYGRVLWTVICAHTEIYAPNRMEKTLYGTVPAILMFLTR